MRELAVSDKDRLKRADDDEFNLTWHGKTKLTRRRKVKKEGAGSLAAAKVEDELLRNKIMGGRRK